MRVPKKGLRRSYFSLRLASEDLPRTSESLARDFEDLRRTSGSLPRDFEAPARTFGSLRRDPKALARTFGSLRRAPEDLPRTCGSVPRDFKALAVAFGSLGETPLDDRGSRDNLRERRSATSRPPRVDAQAFDVPKVAHVGRDEGESVDDGDSGDRPTGVRHRPAASSRARSRACRSAALAS
jgi:hypothetical protein